MFSTFGCQKELINHDRWTYVVDNVMKETTKIYKIKCRLISSCHPQANGQPGKTNGIL